MPGRDVGVPRPAIHVPRSWSGRTACDVTDHMSFEYVVYLCTWCCRWFAGRNIISSGGGIDNLIDLSQEGIVGQKTIICIFILTRDHPTTTVAGQCSTDPLLDSDGYPSQPALQSIH